MAKKRKNNNTTNSKKVTTGSETNSHIPFDSFPLDLVRGEKKQQHNHKHQHKRRLLLKELVPNEPVWVVPQFLTPTECQQWIAFCESASASATATGSSRGMFEYTYHPADRYTAHRECYRLQQTDATVITDVLYRRLMANLLTTSNNTNTTTNHNNNSNHNKNNNNQFHTKILHYYPNGYTPIGFNPNLRLYKYTKGHSFGKHVDGSNYVPASSMRPSNGVGGSGDGGTTEITVLIYLSSCTGGATRFYSATPSAAAAPSRTKIKNNKNFPKHPPSSSSFAFDPVPGTMLLHIHGDRCLEHEADPVLDGVKYVLRTDVVFSK